MDKIDFTNKKVNKKWGHEYLLYENDDIVIWRLLIKEGESTSLHCHPNKCTSLCVISGGAKVSFLSDSYKLFPGDKMTFRAGVFHKTEACVGDVELLEVECSKDKFDLVRLEDKYNRVNQPYENESNYESFDTPKFPKINTSFQLGKCQAILEKIKPSKYSINIPTFKYNHTYIVLKGHVRHESFSVVSPGTIIKGQNLKLMFDKFLPDEELLMLSLEHKI